MTSMRARRLAAAACAVALATATGDASAHPWHRHSSSSEPTTSTGDANADRITSPPPVDPRFRLVAARKPGSAAIDIAAAFAAFEKTGAVACRRDDRFFYVESNGVPDHPLMVGIRAWQQQVPLPQKYVGANAWQIPLHPVPAATPALTKDRFLRGAIALAVNGIPIFNPLNNRGEDAFKIGELDDHGGHCGRADDYHYHLAPVHLQEQVGEGMPIAYALDGYPIYGYVEPDGSEVVGLDELGGHEDADGHYHYHATKTYPYLNGGFRGAVTEREGQVDPQPRAEPVRRALPPLRGATIVGFTAPTATSRKLTYEVDGRKGTVEYAIGGDGAISFTYTDPAGKKTTETAKPRGGGGRGGPGGARGEGRDRPPRPGDDPPPPRPGSGPPPRPGDGPPPRPGEGPPRGRPGSGERSNDRPLRPGDNRAQPRSRQPPGRDPDRDAASPVAPTGGLAVTSAAIGADGRLPVEFTCDGAGISPPVAWQAGPRGTKSYALVLWHEAPDQVKSYWLVHGIPATVTAMPKGAKNVGTMGLNDKRRAEYDPMCSKGPGLKTYNVTVYALSSEPQLPATGANREALLAAIKETTLAEGTLTFTYERGGSR
jgi:phosphatidylethanolamine-binding protein (PEBP) family uncharacterized protein